jgi:hypothetical protein
MGTKRRAAKTRRKPRDLMAKKTKTVKGGTGTASAFIPGAGVISAAISNASPATRRSAG